MFSKSDATVVDLFSGAGGLSLSAARAGFRLVASIDNDPHAINAHKTNFPTAQHFCEDIRNLNGADLARSLKIDRPLGVIGGPPCQGFSAIGKRRTSDSRNQLFLEFFRLVRELRPSFFLAENVPGILAPAHSLLIKRALSSVKSRYHLLPPLKLHAHLFGAPTNRCRVFFIGFEKGSIGQSHPNPPALFAPPDKIELITVSKALSGLPKQIDPDWQSEEQGWRRIRKPRTGYFFDRLWGHIPDGVGDPLAISRLYNHQEVSGCLGTKHSRELSKRYGSTKPGTRDEVSKSWRLELDGFCPTLRAGTASDRGSFQAVRPLHPTLPRVITPREGARLQGFPDWFQFAPTKWHSFRLLGNSVSPILGEYIFRTIAHILDSGEMINEARKTG